ncbi:hypothetical protein CcaverHIS002_0203330 [Cutaneotrichosporon cavernicola]|uniref:RRM domain-containing protein n=1 Tax=Cutaneotrichosporon cavernicola TaxID=279322 RepID=A0AA48L122_9TREE|nr:uncharacterized protein CcaverHIS019_0203320 [Cutaneotrichosporon cavernicola]BEI81173.1 hypothetical protein CcaverHIS002_0203330 [Cutaneotrichosporon cavernicola]BEI88970.1 hypothetical protein CcaverHIS019_0203320 [Cutaneotrichosporon cavernicola]BEI96747.1 hypothetical protein CcaverHIS631_0203360 [Cutaneotrichosporon cavernicola]BEJ04519.1 hypothetical protein CcaverHIS641_0203360 [Cutaneotrichosporon cavernicola]
MDLDKPLEEMIPKRGGRGGRSGRGGAERKPRLSHDRRDAAPYARPPTRSTEDKWVHDAFEGGRGTRGGRERRDRDRAPDAPVSSSPRIEISGLHYESIFEQAGTIVQGPTIAYDRSGRPTGTATVEYTTPQMAKIAINKFDGAMTKGQTIAIKLIAPARAPKADKGESSLLARLGGGSLKDRMGGDRPQRDERGPRPDRAPRQERGGDRGRGGRGRGGKPRPERRKPANADDLDKELDGFMDKPGDVKMA